jgi:hypothetical protein
MYKITSISFAVLGLTLQTLCADPNEIQISESLSYSYCSNGEEHEEAVQDQEDEDQDHEEANQDHEDEQYAQRFFAPQIDGLSKASKPKK